MAGVAMRGRGGSGALSARHIPAPGDGAAPDRRALSAGGERDVLWGRPE